MIRFACPRCKTVIERADQEAGAKFSCTGCGQRLQVPGSVNKTAPEGAANWDWVGGAVGVAPVADAPPPVVEAPRRSRDYDDDDFDDRPRRRRSRYEDDDYEPRIRRYTASGRPASEDECARSSTTGFLCAVISIALLLVAAIIWVVMVAEGPRGGQANPLVFLILLIGIISFVLGLIGVVFSSRGLDPINQRNRGIAVAGLVCGILGMVVGLIGSIFFFCIGLVLMSRPF